ncbi:hypothetical protein VP01_288g5 [Puccinia sorghi]|uniref:AB hydrolase-1 domain-containing protein n=1 Tax=Puccinia sorghi TaxID=27349 RepID=A0A0L6V3H0_9BASI|nr:hypothetical protein VP01_288g5 [Puccinia sorghi]
MHSFILSLLLFCLEHTPEIIYTSTLLTSILFNQKRLILAYLLLEVLFHWLFIHRKRRTALTKGDDQVPAVVPSLQLRKQLLHALITSFNTTHHLTNALTNWFYSSNQHHIPIQLDQIHHQNIAQLLAALFFSKHYNQLNHHHRNQILLHINTIQHAINHTFPHGLNPHILSYQHNLDPIHAQHRPLCFYLLIEAFRLLLHITLRLVGFQKHVIKLNQTHFQYWYHPGFHSKRQETPLILVAGIVGLISLPHYAISLLWKSRRPIFLVGNPTVSLTLFKPELDLVRVRNPEDVGSKRQKYRRKIQTLAEQSLCMKEMLHRHGYQPRANWNKGAPPDHGGAFLIGHSLGTCATAHFLRHHPQYVAGTLSIDPISVMPYIPDLVRGFLYTKPKTLGQLLVRIVSRELGVATYIQRHFHWFEFVIFPHLEQTTTEEASMVGVSGHHGRHHFVLSERDALVCHAQLAAYLARAKPPCSVSSLANSPHAGFLFFHLPTIINLTLDLLPPRNPSSQTTLPSSKPHSLLPPPRSHLQPPFSCSSFPTSLHHLPVYYWFLICLFLALGLPS